MESELYYIIAVKYMYRKKKRSQWKQNAIHLRNIPELLGINGQRVIIIEVFIVLMKYVHIWTQKN